MNLETAQSLSAPQFKRRFGVQPETFKQMVKALQTQQPKPPSPGRPSALSVEAEIWVTLEPTFRTSRCNIAYFKRSDDSFSHWDKLLSQ